MRSIRSVFQRLSPPGSSIAPCAAAMRKFSRTLKVVLNELCRPGGNCAADSSLDLPTH
jgi:hypothetical protein